MGGAQGKNAGCRDPAFPVRSGALCYPECKPGFHNVAGVCWQDKTEGSKDDGAFFKPEMYGKGVGTLPICSKDKELNGRLCYDKTPDDCHNVGGVIYKKCPPGFRDDGLFCAKPGTSYGAGVQGTKQGC